MVERTADGWWRYLDRAHPGLTAPVLGRVRARILATPWETPTTGIAWNNVGVLLLARATLVADTAQRAEFVRLASQAFRQSAALHSPLGAVHGAVCTLLLEGEPAADVALRAALISALHPVTAGESAEPGLVFLPDELPRPNNTPHLSALLSLEDSNLQALRLAATLREAVNVWPFDAEATHRRALARELAPDDPAPSLEEGLVGCAQGRPEALATLLRAHLVDPRAPGPIHALFLAWLDQGRPAAWERWYELGRTRAAAAPGDPRWAWTRLHPESPYTQVSTPDGIVTVPASLRGLSTPLLLARGRWFEGEIDLWRRLCTPGAVVVDVGASHGLYTVAAARAAGETGRVIAVEPFPTTAWLLRRTVADGPWPQVEVVEAAASSAAGRGWIGGASTSELYAFGRDRPAGAAVEVDATTVDRLLVDRGLERLDLLKIDAEGHELPVLQGAMRSLESRRPIVFYESRTPSGTQNQAAAFLLKRLGYRLFRWNRWLGRLTPADAPTTSLNLVALPAGLEPAALGI